MKVQISRAKVHKSEFLFLAAYICFFIALFLGDVAIETSGMQLFTKVLRYASYLLSFMQLIMHRSTLKQLVREAMIWAVSLLFFVFTRDAYLPMLVILVVGSRDSSVKRIGDISLKLLAVGTAVIVAACLIGLIPDVMTAKAFSDELTRHSFGFYHSNVLPNNLLMIELLLVWKYKEKLSAIVILAFFLLHSLVYVLSASRMCLLVAVLLTALLLLFKWNSGLRSHRRLTALAAYSIAPICSVVSLALTLLVPANALAQRIDVLLSCRFSISYQKLQSVGLKLFNFISNAQFIRDGLVLDNGYLYVLLRYGFVVLAALNLIGYLLVKKYAGNTFYLICIACVFAIGFIDNLFLGYRFLPFLLFACIPAAQATQTVHDPANP